MTSQATQPNSSSLEQAMETLTAQWYNAIIAGIGLDPNTFQLVQGSQQVGTTSETLWQFYNSVPPLSVSQYYNPSAFNNFAQDYGGVVNNLIPQGQDALQNSMGDYYSKWLAFVKANPLETSLADFKAWATGVAPSQAGGWTQLYADLFDSPLYLASMAWAKVNDPSITNSGVYAFDKSYEMLSNQLLSALPKNVSMDSSTESSSVTNTWAKGEVAGILDDFFGGGDSSYSSLSETVATSSLDISAKFKRELTFASGPLSQPSSDPILSQYTPWYNSEAISIAYKTNNNSVWKHGAPTWDGTFGTAGNLQYTCSALVIVDGIDITVSSSASLSEADQAKFSIAAAGGFFPFFEAEVSSGWSTSTSFNDQGQATITSSLGINNPQVLGVIVSPDSEVFG